MRGLLHCYYKDIYGIRTVAQELNNTAVWLNYGFDRLPSRGSIDHFLIYLEQTIGGTV